MIYTPKCTCFCPKSLHSHVGCEVEGCKCLYGLPSTKKELLVDCGFEESEIEIWPEEFRAGWDRDNPDWTVEDFLLEDYEFIQVAMANNILAGDDLQLDLENYWAERQEKPS